MYNEYSAVLRKQRHLPTLSLIMRMYMPLGLCLLCTVVTLCDDHFENFSTLASSLDTIAKLEEPKGKWCHCWNDTESEIGDGIECRCFGDLLKTIPKKLPNALEKLTISDAGIIVLHKNSLQPYKTALRDVILTNLAHLAIIETGTFRNIDKLRSLYIAHAPLLNSMPMLFEGVSSKNFLSLRIMHTGLEEIPDLSRINQSKILHMIDLEDNKFKNLPPNSIKVKAEQVNLNHNPITSIAGYAFDGSEIAKLSLKGNRQLTTLSDESFSGLNSLTELDLSGTRIEYLPVKGLELIEILRIQDTKSLKVIPSVYNFKVLKEAWLTHSFHCCAFKFPAQHDPVEHALHTSKLKQFCDALTAHAKHDGLRKKRRVDSNWGESFHEENKGKITFDDIWGLQFDQPKDNNTDTGEFETNNEDKNRDMDIEDEIGTFHQDVFEMPGGSDILCGNISQGTHDIRCYPKPDALNPCEDIMGSYWLRVSVWFVVITAVIGNLAVIVVFFCSLLDINVPKFLMCHLACADICMGFYLLLIASMDIHSMGFYFNFAFDWQFGDGCKIAGFLTVFSSQLSVYTLTIITLERWFAIRYAIYLNRRIRLGAAVKIMAVGWLYSILMASLPLFGISNYSSTSICLPMEIQDPQDRAYLVSLLLTNGLAFLIIVICYTQIYLSLGQETRRGSSNNEMTIAKKMALLVFTDFACWAPIAFFGLTALAGYPLIDVTRSKILLVFFYPLNSCSNPYLYAILTAQYRRDFFMLLYRCGICKKRIRQYTMTSSLPASNQSNPVPMLPRANGRKLSKATNFLDEALL